MRVKLGSIKRLNPELDPTSGRTIVAGQLPRPITDAAVAAIGSRIYALGGISTRPLASVVSVRPR